MSIPKISCPSFPRGPVLAPLLAHNFRAPWYRAAEAYIVAKLVAGAPRDGSWMTRLPPMRDAALVAECMQYLTEFVECVRGGMSNSDRLQFGSHASGSLRLSFDEVARCLVVQVIDDTEDA